MSCFHISGSFHIVLTCWRFTYRTSHVYSTNHLCLQVLVQTCYSCIASSIGSNIKNSTGMHFVSLVTRKLESTTTLAKVICSQWLMLLMNVLSQVNILASDNRYSLLTLTNDWYFACGQYCNISTKDDIFFNTYLIFLFPLLAIFLRLNNACLSAVCVWIVLA